MKKWLSITLGVVTAIGGFLDAGTIATSGEAGAKFGLGLIWAILVATFMVMLLIEMVGRFTAVSQKPYAAAIREELGFRFFLLPLASEVIAESLLLAAELGGMAIALSLITGLSWHILFPVAVVIVFLMAWRAPFDWIENSPALLGLTMLAFLVGVFAMGAPSRELLQTLWKPEIKAGEFADYLYLVAAILGATISPYMLYFYSSGAREEGWSGKSLLLNRITAFSGMGFGSVGSITIVILSAIVLRPQNMQASTLGEIGLALATPFGKIGALLFAVILFVTCLGAALECVLALSYSVAQGFGWPWSEDKKPAEAAHFNLVIVLFLVIAFLIGLIGIDPLQLALFASTVIALFLPISLAPFLILMNDPQYLDDKVNPRWMNIIVMAILLIAFAVAITSIPLELLSGGG
jgi:Mn2+/Fe2+ NRAMP family transporter